MDTALNDAALPGEEPSSSLSSVEAGSAALALTPLPVSPSRADPSGERPIPHSDGEISLSDPLPPAAGRLPVQLDIRIPLSSFRVRDLMTLAPGAVLSTEWPASEDLPISSGDTQLLWVEFEVVDLKLAARVTRVA